MSDEETTAKIGKYVVSYLRGNPNSTAKDIHSAVYKTFDVRLSVTDLGHILSSNERIVKTGSTESIYRRGIFKTKKIKVSTWSLETELGEF